MKPPSPAPVLAFDCACSGLSVAVLRDGAVLARRSEAMATGQSAALAPAIETALREAGVAPAELGLIAVTAGPGSFTGIRIGLAMARGLALALDVPLAACSTFDAVRHGLSAQQRQRIDADDAVLVAAIDSRREEIFVALGDGPRWRESVIHPADAVAALPSRAHALVGDAADALREAFAAAGRGGEIVLCDARAPDAALFGPVLAAAGPEHWRRQNARDGLPRPLYLRGADVTLPRAATLR